jgi:hypothetical protein
LILLLYQVDEKGKPLAFARGPEQTKES